MRRLLCDRKFEDMIADTAMMTLKEFEKKLQDIEVSGTELQQKLVVLGADEKKARDEIEKLIGQKQQPIFSSLAKMFEKGTYNILYSKRAHLKYLKRYIVKNNLADL